MNERQETGTIQMDVVIYPEDSSWIAQALQFDIAAKGQTPIEAADNFTRAVAAEVVMSLELGDPFPLAGVKPAPQEFWQLYKQADTKLEKEVSPIGLPELPAAPRIVPRLKMSDKRLVPANGAAPYTRV